MQHLFIFTNSAPHPLFNWILKEEITDVAVCVNVYTSCPDQKQQHSAQQSAPNGQWH